MVLVRKFVYIKGKQVNEEDDAVIAKKAKEVFDVASKPSSSNTDEWALVVHHAFLHTLPRRRVEVDSVPRKRNHGPVDFAALLPAEILLHILLGTLFTFRCATKFSLFCAPNLTNLSLGFMY